MVASKILKSDGDFRFLPALKSCGQAECPIPNVERGKMKKKNETELIDVNESNVSETGFFCFMSKRKSQGYRRKLDWLQLRFGEGLKIKMLGQGQRGFIEYIPGEYAWRAVNANGFMMIHCLWVVGKSKGQGFGSLLLNACLKDAKKLGAKGVAAVISRGNWLIGKGLLENHGFESVGQAPPSFELMVKPFGNGRPPSFTNHWDKKAKRCGRGLTIIRSNQCPYLQDATLIALEAAESRGIRSHVIELENCEQVRADSPSAYGVFSIVYNGKLLSYHYLTKKDLLRKLEVLK